MLNRSACVFAFFLVACARSTQGIPDPSIPPATDGVRITTGINKARSWTLSPTTVTTRYVSTGTTILELQSDTAATKASVTTRASFALSVSREPGLTRIRGALESFSAQTDGRIMQADQQPTTPLMFSGRLVGGGFNLDSLNGQVPGTGDCRTAGLNNLSSIRQNLFTIPLILAPGMIWMDSSSVSACSGSIPLQLTAIKTYTVVGEGNRNGIPVIIIDRTDRILASGEGAQGQHRVTVTTRGSGSAKIYVDRTSGLLNSLDGEQQAQVTINASGRTQVFTQTVKERTVLN